MPTKLAAAGLVETVEGRSGGYRLGRPGGRTTLGAIVRAVRAFGPEHPAYAGLTSGRS